MRYQVRFNCIGGNKAVTCPILRTHTPFACTAGVTGRGRQAIRLRGVERRGDKKGEENGSVRIGDQIEERKYSLFEQLNRSF